MNKEVWKSLKDIVECGDYYEISNFGNVRSVDRYVNSKNDSKRLDNTAGGYKWEYAN
jgi:hypothetical protein